tara:strand:+ start:22000 stop:22479 length:480 start_codon:yes stop_codon:yes gene_type:complete
MHIDNFRAYQQEGAKSQLYSLVMSCRRRFLKAARLLEVNSPALEKLTAFGVSSSVDVWPLLSPFSVLAERYVEHFFSPQAGLFPDPAEQQDERWNRYFYHVLVPHLVIEDEVVRNVLRAICALPCRQPDEAAMALTHYFSEMTLPESRPPWDPEDNVDC